jgi:signal transduction histidine kinase
MIRKRLLTTTLSVSVIAALPVLAHETGNPEEAEAMLDRAVAELKADPAAALEKFNKGLEGFQDRDLYVFCATQDGKLVAHTTPRMLGDDIAKFKDQNGKGAGKEIIRQAKDGQVIKVKYMFPRPGETEAVAKESYVTRVGELTCGVGYYK